MTFVICALYKKRCHCKQRNREKKKTAEDIYANGQTVSLGYSFNVENFAERKSH